MTRTPRPNELPGLRHPWTFLEETKQVVHVCVWRQPRRVVRLINHLGKCPQHPHVMPVPAANHLWPPPLSENHCQVKYCHHRRSGCCLPSLSTSPSQGTYSRENTIKGKGARWHPFSDGWNRQRYPIATGFPKGADRWKLGTGAGVPRLVILTVSCGGTSCF